MGVLNFAVPVRKTLQNPYHLHDISSFVDNLGYERVLEREIPTPTTSNGRNKRKRTKSSGSNSSFYDFRDYGIDERRKGSRHQRRKQNLLEIGGGDDLIDDVFEDGDFVETRNTGFSELFLDTEKMRKWEDFIDLPDEKQVEYVDENKTTQIKKTNDKATSRFLSIDKKLRGMIKNNKPAANDLLKYYEDLVNDILPPAIILLDLESAYDRMMVYAICQYMDLTSTTTKMNSTAFVEVALEGDWVAPDQSLTNYLLKKH